MSKVFILGNVSADRSDSYRISLDGLYLSSVEDAPWRRMQYFAVPEGYALDSAERLVIAFGEDSLQDAMVSWLGWPADSTVQWVWQDGYVLSDTGEVTLTSWDDQDALVLDVVQYGENGLRRTFAGREAEVAASDFEAGGWNLGSQSVERKSIKFGFGEAYSWTQVRGGKSYELSDHLGNVAVVVGDRRMAFDPNTDLAVDFFEAEVLSARDFYPFGMVMPERSFQVEDFRYGFQNQEMDHEFSGTGNSYTAMFWQYDPRIGKRFNVDPKPNSSNSSYAAFLCNPILYSDQMGDTISIKGSREFINQTLITLNTMKLTKAGNILVSALENSNRTLEITEAKRVSIVWRLSPKENKPDNVVLTGGVKNSYYNSEGGEKGQGKMAYGVTAGEADGGQHNPVVLLGHEAGHAYGHWFVARYYEAKRDFQESQAGIFGNYFRQVFELKLRTRYSGVKHFSPNLWMPAGTTLPPDLQSALKNPERIRFENMGDGIYYSIGETDKDGSIQWGPSLPIPNLLDQSKILITEEKHFGCPAPNCLVAPGVVTKKYNLKQWISK